MIDHDSPFDGPLRAQSQGAAALEGLSVALIRGDFAPSTALSEAEIVARTGFSLAAVRGSLARLQMTGWVSPQPRKGWRVQPLSPSHLLELVALRDRLEPMLADARPTPAQRMALRMSAQALAWQGAGRPVILQERAILHRICDLAPWAKARDWLRDLWDMSLRADGYFAARGFARSPLPLVELADSLGHPDRLLTQLAAMRAEFACNVQLWLAHHHEGDPALAPTAPKAPTEVSPHAS